MCTVTYNVSAILRLMIDMERANTVNTLLFHAYDDTELVHALSFIYSVRYTPHVHRSRGMAIYIAVSKTMLDYVYIRCLVS